MSDAMESMMEYAEVVWPERARFLRIESISDRIQQIYAYYNHSNVTSNPNWRTLLPRLAAQIALTGDLDFFLQNSEQRFGTHIAGTGEQFADAFRAIAQLAEETRGVKGGTGNGNQFMRWLRDKMVSQPRNALNSAFKGGAHLDSNIAEEAALRHFRAELGQMTNHTLAQHPTAIIGDFLYHTAPGATDAARYRVYITPKLEWEGRVYAELVNFINGRANSGERTERIPSKARRPCEAKLGLPRPGSTARSDRIVVYCTDRAQMQTTVDWLRLLQANMPLIFEDRTPRGMKPVEGLKGVGVSTEPNPPRAFDKATGIDRWSFGFSRAGIIALALNRGPKTLHALQEEVKKVARKYKFDLKLKKVRVN